ALIIGWIGDRTNRRTALLLCSFTTGLGTFGIGCLPDVQTAGILAPLLLVLMRLLQGFGMAGEFCSVLVVTGELSPPAHRGILTSLVHSSAMMGTLIASLVVMLVFWLPEASLYSWGWRCPFWLGGMICFTAWFLRKQLPSERPVNHLVSTKTSLWKNRAGLVRMFLVVSGNTLIYHLFFVFFSTQMIEIQNIAGDRAMLINSLNISALVIFCALGGWLGDQFGRKRVYLLCLLIIAVAVVPAYSFLSPAYSWHYSLVVQALFALLGGILLGVSSALYTELLPDNIRMMGTAVPYNLAIVVFGGTAPLIALALTEWSGLYFAPGFYVAVVCLMILLSMKGVEDISGRRLLNTMR
ncbi:MFS transporter, partial [Endozoicomonas arenosclerae]|uniref:MFS transporter n=1 Tax=Endozoicomonas arenosclerae TaxID=1633495 RepID=UPI000783C04E